MKSFGKLLLVLGTGTMFIFSSVYACGVGEDCNDLDDLVDTSVASPVSSTEKTNEFSAPDRDSRGKRGRSPGEILDKVVKKANDDDDIQDTPLNHVSRTEGQYSFRMRITNTLDSVRKRISPYIDWMLYIGLSVATILVIWQGLMLVVGKTFADIRPNMINIVTGVVVLTGVYLIIKVFTELLAWIFNI